MFKVPKQVYTAEFKLAAVQRVKDGQGVTVVAASWAFLNRRSQLDEG